MQFSTLLSAFGLLALASAQSPPAATTTKPPVCYQDNCLRALLNPGRTGIGSFCSAYLSVEPVFVTSGTVTTFTVITTTAPPVLDFASSRCLTESNTIPNRISSACSCVPFTTPTVIVPAATITQTVSSIVPPTPAARVRRG